MERNYERIQAARFTMTQSGQPSPKIKLHSGLHRTQCSLHIPLAKNIFLFSYLLFVVVFEIISVCTKRFRYASPYRSSRICILFRCEQQRKKNYFNFMCEYGTYRMLCIYSYAYNAAYTNINKQSHSFTCILV